ncbi:hypothetical protein NM208_g3743 [Fusarium decemcellulare]|uniref:Uncharacterized protein n=1 Tax=Fusarium decemcellulare TaxID=57161 RepID=A0ACC1SNI6_9HYPO|nr:hypothetical protein NM208_g3743 [Fusarium decemcellulare]
MDSEPLTKVPLNGVTKPNGASQKQHTSGKRIGLPESAFSHLAGHVKRRKDNIVVAEPPPNNPRRVDLVRPTRHPRRGRGSTRKLDHGDGSDSDSDSGNTRKLEGYANEPVAARRRGPGHGDESYSPPAKQEIKRREEADRMQVPLDWVEEGDEIRSQRVLFSVLLGGLALAIAVANNT